MDPKGTIVFTTVGRTNYGFDVFSVDLTSDLKFSENRLTDGVSINYNAQFINHNDQSIVYISERSGCPRVHSSLIGAPNTQQLLQSHSQSLFYDRPIINNNRLYFISAHEQPEQPFKSWSALFCSDLGHQNGDHINVITRLTPYGVVDFSPAISRSGEFITVASYGSRAWGGEFHEIDTDIVVFKRSNPEKRLIVCEKGGWPTWSGDDTVYFHRQADDGWWSIFQVNFSGEFSESPISTPIRITPPGVHCFTPAAMHDAKRIAVATRRRNQTHRHIEIFELATSTFYPVTETINPKFHHYNPFVSTNSEFLGYHRFRGELELSTSESMIPNIEPVVSPIKDLRMLRLSGSFPSFSPAGDLIAFNPDFVDADGGLKIVKSDGTKKWSLLKNRVAFCNSWSRTEKNVIYTSIGPIFESVRTPVQVARITFNPSDLHGDISEIASDVKILTRDDTGNNAFPSCSPDGKSLVFRSGRSGHKNLYIIDAVDGEFNGSIRRLTDGSWIDTMPSWSPRGDLIAFSSNRHNPENPAVFSIYVVKTDGSDLRRLHVAGAEGSSEVDMERNNHVCWSKDGEWMLFTSNMGSVTAEPISLPNQFQPYGELYVVRFDGSGLRRLTWNGYEDGTPTWLHGDDDDDKDLDFGKLNLDEQDGDRLNGQFDEPLWINCDI